MTAITIAGSHGEFTVDALGFRCPEPAGAERAYPTVTAVNLAEWEAYWSRGTAHAFREEAETIDILDVGLWYTDGTYAPPVAEFRESIDLRGPAIVLAPEAHATLTGEEPT